MRITAHGSVLFVALLAASTAAAAAPARTAASGTVRVIRQPATTAPADRSGEAASSDASRAPSATFTCTPSGVGVFETRIHVHCTTADANGVSYFAYRNTDAAQTARILSVLLVAYTTNSYVIIYYDPADTSGTAWGCQAGDCRVFTGASMVK